MQLLLERCISNAKSCSLDATCIIKLNCLEKPLKCIDFSSDDSAEGQEETLNDEHDHSYARPSEPHDSKDCGGTPSRPDFSNYSEPLNHIEQPSQTQNKNSKEGTVYTYEKTVGWPETYTLLQVQGSDNECTEAMLENIVGNSTKFIQQLSIGNELTNGKIFTIENSARHSDDKLHIKSTHAENACTEGTVNTFESNVENQDVFIQHKSIHLEDEQGEKQPSGLKSHKITRSRGKRDVHLCDICGFKADHSRALIMHKSSSHGEKHYRCSLCDYSTNWSNDLLLHQRKHHGGKAYQCDRCQYSTLTSSLLEAHKIAHLNKKADGEHFACDECDFRTRWPQSLSLHKKTHRGEITYKQKTDKVYIM